MEQTRNTQVIMIFVAALCIAAIAFGIRQSFGLFMRPISVDLGWGREILSFTLATQSLIIGLAAPLSGALADRWGPGRVIMAGGALFTLGMVLMSQASVPAGMIVGGGFLAGLGLSACGLPLMVSVVGRIASDNRRSLWMGLITGCATLGQVALLPVAQGTISTFGWSAGLLALAACAALIVPLAAFIARTSGAVLNKTADMSLRAAVHEARNHRGYWLLTAGFFVCGFQVLFIAAHLPAYLVDRGIDAGIAATSLGVIAVCNMLGSWCSGWLGGRYRKKYLLSGLYTCRSLVIIAFISVPVSNLSVLLFAGTIGFLWLGTVPLTSGIVAQVFGPRYMATLYGFVYLSHQVGSFTGIWLGGWLFDVTGSYDGVWLVSIALGFAAAALHMPINDAPIAREAPATA
jgi:MFS family permease